MTSMRPGRASGRVRSASTRDDPVSRNRPGVGSRSTATLIGRSRSGTSWISSMTMSPSWSTKPVGSSRADRSVAGSSSNRVTVFARWRAASLVRVLLPAWRAPLTSTTRVSASASVTSDSACRGTRSGRSATGPLCRTSKINGHLDGEFVVRWPQPWWSPGRTAAGHPDGPIAHGSMSYAAPRHLVEGHQPARVSEQTQRRSIDSWRAAHQPHSRHSPSLGRSAPSVESSPCWGRTTCRRAACRRSGTTSLVNDVKSSGDVVRPTPPGNSVSH